MLNTAAAFLGTMAFAVLFGVPARHNLLCGVTGAAGWVVYEALTGLAGATPTEATFAAALVVTLLSRVLAVRKACPATVFLVTGIFPLVPGAGIYWTAYYTVSGQLEMALSSGFAAVKAAAAIVLGIVFVFEIPGGFFGRAGRNRKV